jgi:hypothetical protein
VRPIALLLAALALTGCSGSGSGSSEPRAPASAAAPPGPGTSLYAGGDWAVVVDGVKATAFHRVAGTWRADTSRAVKIRILGPHGTAPRRPQVAAELSAKKPLVESGMWVDGRELLAKGGGLLPTRGTIYGAPSAPLVTGPHVAVAYGRTAEHATAVGWSFRVK